jgi:hypothetical protein
MFFYFFHVILRNVVHLGPVFRLADRKVVLGAVPSALGAVAPRLAATFVAFDEGTPQYSGQVWQTPQERFLSSPQSFGGFRYHVDLTSYITGQNLAEFHSFVNPFFRIIKGLHNISDRRETTEIQECFCWGIAISLVGPLTRNRKRTHRSSLKEQGIDSANSTGFKNRKTMTAQRMKGMGYLSVSQRGAAMMCI